MSLNHRISWTAATRDMRNDRTAIPAGLLAARGLIECFARTRRPLVVAGKFDRAAIMAHAAAAAILRGAVVVWRALLPSG
jgi:hypothetical protein